MSDTRKHCCFEIFVYKLILCVRGIEIFIKISTEDVKKCDTGFYLSLVFLSFQLLYTLLSFPSSSQLCNAV